mgnify:CR=1 FL=1
MAVAPLTRSRKLGWLLRSAVPVSLLLSATLAITTDIVEQAVDKAAIRYDRDGDQHYDVTSAFIKSISQPTHLPEASFEL